MVAMAQQELSGRSHVLSGSVPRAASLGLIAKAIGLVLSLAAVVAPRSASAFRTAANDPSFSGTARVAIATPPLHFRLVTDSASELNSFNLEIAVNRAIGAWAAPACASNPFVFDRASADVAMFGDASCE